MQRIPAWVWLSGQRSLDGKQDSSLKRYKAEGWERKQHEVWRCGCKADYYQMLLINHSLATPLVANPFGCSRLENLLDRCYWSNEIPLFLPDSAAAEWERSWNKQPPLSPFFQSPGTRHLFLSWKVNTSREWVFLYLEKGTQEEAINIPR